MSIKASEVTKRAKKMKSDGYVYVYGYKGTKITKSGVNALARQYPSVFTYSIKAIALKKVGKIGIDCSGYVSQATKTSFGGSTNIKDNLTELRKVSDDSNVMDGMVIWRQGHIATIEVDSSGNAFINEAQSTAGDLKRTPWKDRASHFTSYGKCPGVTYNTANVKGVGKIIATVNVSTACTFYKKPDVKEGSIRALSKGTSVKIISDTKKGWSKVWYKGNIGYVKNSCLKYVGLSGYPTATVKKKAALRNKNKKTGKKLATIKVGTKIKVICKRKYWTNVICDDKHGWIATKKIKF